MSKKNISIESIDAFVFDFDGVLTDNLVYVREDGLESVVCSRADGLAFDVLKKLKKSSYILSTEKNPVVTKRANKLGVKAIQGETDKVSAIKKIAEENNHDLKKIFFVGNDLNDLGVIKKLYLTACPNDSHVEVKKSVLFALKTDGGRGIVREILEEILGLNIENILYNES